MRRKRLDKKKMSVIKGECNGDKWIQATNVEIEQRKEEN